MVALDDQATGPIHKVDDARVMVLSRAWVELLDQATNRGFRQAFPPTPVTATTPETDRLRAAGAPYVLALRGDLRPWINAQTIAAQARYDALRTPLGPAASETGTVRAARPIYRQPLFWGVLGIAGIAGPLLLRKRRPAGPAR